MNLYKLAFFLIVFLLIPIHLCSDDKTDQCIQNQLEREITEIQKFIDDYNQLVTSNSQSRAIQFEFLLSKTKDCLNNHLNIYKGFLNQPTDKNCLGEAITGTEMVISSLIDLKHGIFNAKTEKLLTDGIRKIASAKKSIDGSRRHHELWHDLTFNSMSFGKPLLAVYIYLFVVGLLLNRSFRKKLHQLINKSSDLFKFKEDTIYGIHLILLLPVLFLSIFFALFLVWDFGWLVARLLTTGVGPLKLVIVFFIVLIISVFALLISLFKSNKKPDNGLVITRDIEPNLWKLCDAVAQDVSTKPLDRIVFSYNSGIGVYETGGIFKLLFGKPERTLTIGIGAITGMTISQMKSILGHEFGHFSKKDTSWCTLTSTMSYIVHYSLAQMESIRESESMLIQICAYINPVYWVLSASRLLILHLTNGFSRVREVHADKMAISLYGHHHFSKALLKVARNDLIYLKYYLPQLQARVQPNVSSDVQFFCDLEQIFQSIENVESANIDADVFEEPDMDFHKTHPPLKDRLNYASRFDYGVHQDTQNESFQSIFLHWNEIRQSLSNYYNDLIRAWKQYAQEESLKKQL